MPYPGWVLTIPYLWYVLKKGADTSPPYNKTDALLGPPPGDFNSTGAYVPVLQENFQVDCGCNSTTSSVAPTPSLGFDSRENTPITSSPLGENAAGNGNPSPAPSFAPFVVDRLGTSGGAPGASVDVSVVVMVGLGTVVGFVRRLVGGW